jgi:hypothetical protein
LRVTTPDRSDAVRAALDAAALIGEATDAPAAGRWFLLLLTMLTEDEHQELAVAADPRRSLPPAAELRRRLDDLYGDAARPSAVERDEMVRGVLAGAGG